MQPKGIIWAGLSVQDLAGEIAFYRDVLGLTLRRSGADWAHFEAGGGALFELFSGGQAQEGAKSPAEQALVIGFEVEDLAAEVAVLESRGVRFSRTDRELTAARAGRPLSIRRGTGWN